MNKVLIVIDAQEDFTRGSLRNEEAIKALPVIKEVVEFANKNFDTPVLYTKDTHYQDYFNTQEGKNLPVEHCTYGTKGWEICPEVYPGDSSSYIILKSTFGALDWDILPFFDRTDEIWICGFCTDICVSANFQILKAMYPEIPITIISDGCAGVTPELHEAALKVMQSCQAKIIDWEALKNEETKND